MHRDMDELRPFNAATEKEYLSLEELCQRIPYRPQTIRNRDPFRERRVGEKIVKRLACEEGGWAKE